MVLYGAFHSVLPRTHVRQQQAMTGGLLHKAGDFSPDLTHRPPFSFQEKTQEEAVTYGHGEVSPGGVLLRSGPETKCVSRNDSKCLGFFCCCFFL